MAAALLASSCVVPDSSPELPELPEVDLSAFDETMRERARAVVEEARAKPEDASAVGRMGMFLHAYDRLEKAAVCYERAAGLAADDWRWTYYRAVIMAALSRPEEAENLFRSALERERGSLAARAHLARLFRESGRLKESRDLYEELLVTHPDEASLHYELGLTLAAEGNLEEAIAHYEQAVRGSPDAGAIHYALGLAYRRTGKREKARHHLEQAGDRSPPPLPDPLMDEVRSLRVDKFQFLKAGNQAVERGDMQGAMGAFEQALELDPGFAQAHANLVGVYGMAGDFRKAKEHYEAALAVNPKLADLHYNWGVAISLAGRNEEAREAFERAVDLNPNHADAHQNLGYILEQSGNRDDAVNHYKAALKAQPDHRLAHYHLGRHYVAEKEFELAIEQLLRTLAPEDERTPRFHYVLADAYLRAGQRDLALKHARKAAVLAEQFEQEDLRRLIERDIQTLVSTSSVR